MSSKVKYNCENCCEYVNFFVQESQNDIGTTGPTEIKGKEELNVNYFKKILIETQ